MSVSEGYTMNRKGVGDITVRGWALISIAELKEDANVADSGV